MPSPEPARDARCVGQGRPGTRRGVRIAYLEGMLELLRPSRLRQLARLSVLYFGVSPLRVDILGSASGIDFEGVYQRASEATLDGVALRIIGIEDLIINKRAAGRPRDLEDCRELERIRRKRREA